MWICGSGQKRWWIFSGETPITTVSQFHPNRGRKRSDCGHPEASYLRTALSGVDACACRLKRVAVVPGHPLRRVVFQLVSVPLQVSEIVERITFPSEHKRGRVGELADALLGACQLNAVEVFHIGCHSMGYLLESIGLVK